MFVRSGAIIPMGPEMSYTGEKPQDPITFNIYPDDQGAASMTLYEDDGVSPAYKQAGFRRTSVTVKRVGPSYVVTAGAPQGSYNPGTRKFSFVVKLPGRTRVVTTNDSGSEQTIRLN
jgi:alpha-glucosidase (family GH31 glycosyl hydrolase)